MTKSFQFGLNKIADAFQKRARNLFIKFLKKTALN